MVPALEPLPLITHKHAKVHSPCLADTPRLQMFLFPSLWPPRQWAEAPREFVFVSANRKRRAHVAGLTVAQQRQSRQLAPTKLLSVWIQALAKVKIPQK